MLGRFPILRQSMKNVTAEEQKWPEVEAIVQHDLVEQPMPVQHTRVILGKSLARLTHDERNLQAELNAVAERLRQTRVTMAALQAAFNSLVEDENKSEPHIPQVEYPTQVEM